MKYLDKYAELLIELGVGLRQGQNLMIQTEPFHANFAYLLEKIAYQKGARLVVVELNSPKSQLNRANYSKAEHLEYLPSYWKNKTQSFVDEEWSSLIIGGKENPDFLKDMNQANYAKSHKAFMPIVKNLMAARGDGTCTWCIGNLPTPKWARGVFGNAVSELSDQEVCEKLWDIMIPILRLDKDDTIAAWKENSDNIHRRAEILNQFELEHLHFEGPDTDLKVYMTPYYQFIGGSVKGKYGQDYFPNVPSEEFFTTPDYRRTHGKIKVTRPVNVLGVGVHGAWFEFEEGAVVNFGADKHKEQLDAYFEMDPKARYLGEVALVDCNSPIYKSNLVFNDILFDENAACHIALGRGYSMALLNGNGKSAEELDELGCNNSIVHTDFMIGSESLNVKAVSKTGKELEVIRNGHFTI